MAGATAWRITVLANRKTRKEGKGMQPLGP